MIVFPQQYILSPSGLCLWGRGIFSCICVCVSSTAESKILESYFVTAPSWTGSLCDFLLCSILHSTNLHQAALGELSCWSWVFDLYMPHQRFCFMLVSRLQGLKWGSSKWTFASSPEVESCCSTAGISYEVLPPDWNMEFCLFGFFLRSRAKLYPKDTCIIHWVLSVQLPVCYKGKGLFVQSPVALRVSPRDPLQPDALIYYPYFIFFKNLFILQYIKVFHLLKSTNKHNYFYYYTTFYSVLAAAQLKLH